MGYYQKSPYPPTGYSGYVDELSNQLNTAVISYASVCILQAGAFRILQKIFQKLCPLFGKAKSRLYYPAKRGGTTAFRQKGGDYMEPNRREFQKQCVFQSFCKRVLHNEACNAHDEIRRRRKREVSFCDLALHEERQLYTTDKYFQAETAEPTYQMAGKEITPKLLLEAIRTLPEEKRTAILLYYFEGMTDVEIGKMFNTSRSTIQYRRTSSFELLKKYLEEHADEWNEW